MLLLFDVGNTSVSCGKVEKGRFHPLGSFLSNDIPKKIGFWLKSGGREDNNVVISSVVPETTLKIKNGLSRFKNTCLWVAGQNLHVNISHKYKSISNLGMDRRVCIYGALRLYKPPFLILDYGTAITADYVDAKGVFQGGMIIPGPELAYQALLNRAAMLPKKARLPQKTLPFLGRSTIECLQTGILQAYSAMTDGLVEKFRNNYGDNLQVIATGGFAKQLSPLVSSFNLVDSSLCLKSLRILFEEQHPRR